MANLITDITTRDRILDANGEMVSEQAEQHIEMQHSTIENEEPYVKLYLSHLASFYQLPNGTSDLLFCMISHVNLIDSLWAGFKHDSKGRIAANQQQKTAAKLYLNSVLKQELCELLHISLPTFDRRLRLLCDHGILRRVGRGTYQLNPYILARGNWAEIKELRATYDYVNGTVTTEIAYDNPDE